MPHRCTTCDRTFPDGSKQMLTGCPDCDGKKFEFIPGGVDDAPEPGTASDADAALDAPDGGADATEPPADREDTAQASARRTFVSDDELPAVDPSGAGAGIEEAEPPDLQELRAELNEQFESIKILQPGEYELNLMELYDREEHIVALEEDGRYVIDVPTSWREDDPDDR